MSVRRAEEGQEGPPHFSVFEPTRAYARWALMHRFLYVCDMTG